MGIVVDQRAATLPALRRRIRKEAVQTDLIVVVRVHDKYSFRQNSLDCCVWNAMVEADAQEVPSSSTLALARHAEVTDKWTLVDEVEGGLQRYMLVSEPLVGPGYTRPGIYVCFQRIDNFKRLKLLSAKKIKTRECHPSLQSL